MFGQKRAMGTGIVLGLLVGLATLLGAMPVYAQQAPVNPQFIGDYDCGFSERMVGTLNNEIVQETWAPERDYNHRINPGSSGAAGGIIDELAACTRLNLGAFAIGFQLPTLEALLQALIDQIIDAVCSAVRRQIGSITSLFPSVPCYRGCTIGYNGYGLGSGSAASATTGAAPAPGQAVFGGGTQLTPSQQWDSVRSLFQAEPAAPAGSEQPR